MYQVVKYLVLLKKKKYPVWLFTACNIGDNQIACMCIFTQMEMQDFKEPILTDLRNLQHEKAQLEKVRINYSLYKNVQAITFSPSLLKNRLSNKIKVQCT